MIYILSFRDANRKKGGPVTVGSLEMVSNNPGGSNGRNHLMIEPKITFLIHGFNVTLPDGREKLTNLARHLETAIGGAIVAVLWPGDHFIGALSYPFEGRDADETARNMIKYVIELADIQKSVPLSFVTHSMGGRVGMEVIKGLAREGYNINQVCLMAAAIDNFSLAEMEEYRAGVERCNRVAVLSSRKDRVLRYAYPAGDLLQAFLFSRDEPGLALGFGGPHRGRSGSPVPANVIKKKIPKNRKARHSHYVPDFLPGGHDPKERDQVNQLLATNYALAVLLEDPDPAY